MPVANAVDGWRQGQRLERIACALPIGFGRNATPAHSLAAIERILKVNDDLTSPLALRVEARALKGDRYAFARFSVNTNPERVQIDQFPWRRSYFGHEAIVSERKFEAPASGVAAVVALVHR